MTTPTQMNREQALWALRMMVTAVQKSRSNLVESMGDDAGAQKMLADIAPWLFGPRCVLPKLLEYLGRIEGGAPIKGADLYNFMWIARREPALSISTFIATGQDLPEPDRAWYSQVW